MRKFAGVLRYTPPFLPHRSTKKPGHMVGVTPRSPPCTVSCNQLSKFPNSLSAPFVLGLAAANILTCCFGEQIYHSLITESAGHFAVYLRTAQQGEITTMEERRKLGDRRTNTSKRRAPFECRRQIANRRKKYTPRPKKHWTEYDIDLITRCLTDGLDGYR